MKIGICDDEKGEQGKNSIVKEIVINLTKI